MANQPAIVTRRTWKRRYTMRRKRSILAFHGSSRSVRERFKEAQSIKMMRCLDIYSNMTDWMADLTDPILSFDHVRGASARVTAL
jgi:hypothetical protein